MPRYYFHLYDDLDTPDEEGCELADDEAARSYAVENVREVAAAQVSDGKLDLEHRIEVENADGQVVETIRFADAIEVRD